MQLHAYHQHAEQSTSHHTIWLQFQPDMPVDIWPHLVTATFQKFESSTGTSLVATYIKEVVLLALS